MNAPDQASAASPSPCIGLCEMAPDTGLCRGCLRTLDEIVQWGGASDAYKRAVWLELKLREQHIAFKEG